MKSLLREPLLHFLLAGAALFALYGRVAEPGAERADRIVVGPDRVAMLAGAFERTWMRQPTPPELERLIDDYVTEEVLYREALALGLDRDDLIVRRRMRQKMEFLNDGLSEREPTEDELRAFLAANRERFAVPARVSFEQVFLDPEGPEAAGPRAAGWLARLRDGAPADELGDPTLLPRALRGATEQEVAGTFGEDFARALEDVPVDAWTGPLTSSFGAHLVRVSGREPERLPPLDEVRLSVAREWQAEERARARALFTDALRERYEIEVRMPEHAVSREPAAP